ncbi:CopG family transcriptional regulator [Massilia sp. MB5]|uniref:CopG family transcriptional regulator n=1 Tax=unclassified Massilia TaxID=2609279 RepID=UPI00067DCE1E|nr:MULTISPECIES: CopG family transcriptional regulator [unclassified Massilia]AKU21912.1 CopG family transcriptional regulator [Massilia sp. NR 4-1]UMR28492.1 CopG family transcriptional regulator [Massilia sp. MB5]
MKIVNIKSKLPDTDKVTVNLGLVDLAQMDLLVGEGFYTNRTDFVRTAIRNLLQQHAEAIRQTVLRKRFVTGLQRYSRAELERVVAAGEQLEIHVLGLATVEDDVTPELARSAIASIQVLGAFIASPAVKDALADRLHT